jgi:DNA-directed RNA polymerase specialized sigma24 family protein
LTECYEKLPDLNRQLLVMRYQSGEHSTREIAAELGRTYEATRKAILRARLALADCVEDALHKDDGR